MRVTRGLPPALAVVSVLVLTAFACISLSSCSERWDGFVYPKRESLGTVMNTGTYSSLAECRQSALAMLKALNASDGDYECGKNCQAPDGGGLSVCEETSR